MARTSQIRVIKKVKASRFRSQFRRLAAGAKGKNVVLIENRRQKPKYLVDKEFLDRLLLDRENILETLGVLADTSLTDYLLRLGKTIDADVRSGRMRLYSTEEVFGKP
ncbi:MAG: hypothetical protein ACRD5F_16420 [Candidatus Acidiferrales bacterium]